MHLVEDGPKIVEERAPAQRGRRARMSLVAASLSLAMSVAAEARPWDLAVLWPSSWDVDYRGSYPDHGSCSTAKRAVAATLRNQASPPRDRQQLKETLLVCVEADARRGAASPAEQAPS